MKVNLIYQNNDTGQQLLETMKSVWDEVECSEFMIEDISYLKIAIGKRDSRLSRTLNSIAAIESSLDTENLKEILNVNKVNCDWVEPGQITKTYEVMLCDLKVLFIRQRLPERAGGKTRYLRENQKTKAVEIARRALLLSGLDIALVTMVLNSRKKLIVTDINPSPMLKEKSIEALIQQVDNILTCKKREVKLGADPEFMLINQRTRKMVSASQFFPKDGMVGCDAIRMPNRQYRPVAELRPRPDRSPIKLVSNIRYALDRATSMAPSQNVNWVAGSQPVPGYSIGGHIHFSNIELTTALVRTLDNYIGIPLFLIEKPATAASRRKKYGYLADYRVKDYGGFEYRTPGSWLMSEKITAAAICLAKIVSTHYLQLSRNVLTRAEAHQNFYSGEKEYFKKVFPQLWSDIQKTEMYDKYEDELAILPYMIENDLQWNEKMDVRKGWKMSGKRKNSKAVQESSRQTDVPANIVAPRESGSTGRSTSTSSRRQNSTGRASRRNTANRQVRVMNMESTVVINAATMRSNQSSLPPGRVLQSGGVRRSYMVS